MDKNVNWYRATVERQEGIKRRRELEYVQSLRKEVQRLREALVQIADEDSPMHEWMMRQLAEETLHPALANTGKE